SSGRLILFSAADVAHLDLGQVCGLCGSQFRIAVTSTPPEVRNPALELLVAGAAPQEAAQIFTLEREQAGIEAAVRRQPSAGAVAAERLGHGGDHADLTGAVGVAP